ncbi:hypothetical protein IAR55_002551 [Kwoniella newhampshirensis]|uniref:Formamidopyrimidine-DNA glycosylase catalytic domain-containing protein n=1 Tax=Kwoniella newhampshirensis TaxID=1651941 RepID=A0AAW0Z1S5_9TREE
MPELPEVERARKLIQESCKGYKIKSVDAKEDKIVYTGGIDHNEFAKEITGRTITGCERKGKTFWMTLSGDGRFPVMHFGMTGMIQLKGQEPTWYRRRPKENSNVWPPKFCKLSVELAKVLEPRPGSVSDELRELAFLDGRRLGRLRLLPDPVTAHPPVSALGFDPVLDHPTLDEFKDLIAKKKGTVKGMIMDQAFSAGVGNWVADEVLYQARIHPACPVPSLSEQNIEDLHHQLRAVPLTAVSVNADSKQFPEDWLFRWRWGKGVKQKKGSEKAKKVKVEEDEEGGEDIKPAGKKYLGLPDGGPATIVFIEVGGRTTAVVEELQKMPEGVEIKPKISKGGKGSGGKKRVKEEDTDEAITSSAFGSDSDEVVTPKKVTTPRQRAALAGSAKRVKVEPEVKAKTSTPARKIGKTKTSDTPPSRRKAANGAGPGDCKPTSASVKDAKKSSNPKPSAQARTSTGRGRAKRQELSEGSSELSDAPE